MSANTPMYFNMCRTSGKSSPCVNQARFPLVYRTAVFFLFFFSFKQFISKCRVQTTVLTEHYSGNQETHLVKVKTVSRPIIEIIA